MESRVDSYETLMRQHDEIGVLAGRLIGTINGDDPDPDVVTVLAARDALSVALVLHLHHEDDTIYPGLAGAGDYGTSDAVREVAAEFSALSGDWRAFMARWTIAAVGADWHGFAVEALALTARLERRIARENELLYPIAVAASHMPLRARKPPTQRD